jgi:hypothetical protein
LQWSGFNYIFNELSAYPTFEGDNVVMMQQSAKYLIKQYKKALKGKNKPQGLMSYLNEVEHLTALQC